MRLREWLVLTTALSGCYAAHERPADAAIDAWVGPDLGACHGAPAACGGERVVDLRTLACDECRRIDLRGAGPDRIDVTTGCADGGRVRVERCDGATMNALVSVTLVASETRGEVGGYFIVDPRTCTCGGSTIPFLMGHTEHFPLESTGVQELALVGAGVTYAVEICRADPCP